MSDAADNTRGRPGHEAGLSNGLLENAGAVEAVAARVVELLAEGTAPRPLLDAKAAAELLGVPASWVLAEARADRIPHVRLGRYVRFDVAELRAWQTECARGPRPRTGTQPVSTERKVA